jgi:putative DNA primase/helicase
VNESIIGGMPDFCRVPQELKACPQWVVWKLEPRHGQDNPTKVPYNARTSKKADSTNRATWETFDTARACYDRGGFTGVGFVLDREDEFVGIDLDGCVHPNGEIAEWAGKIIERLDSYTELSPSGKGVRIFVRGKLPPGCRKLDSGEDKAIPGLGRNPGIEAYDWGRYLTVTGNHVKGTPLTVEARDEELKAFHADMEKQAGGGRARGPGGGQVNVQGNPLTVSDEEVVERLTKGSRSAKFLRLYVEGDTLGHSGDRSRADLALVVMLCRGTNGCREQIDRLFRHSALMRPKWDEKRGDRTYGERTIDRALSTYQQIAMLPAPPNVGDDRSAVEYVRRQIEAAPILETVSLEVAQRKLETEMDRASMLPGTTVFAVTLGVGKSTTAVEQGQRFARQEKRLTFLHPNHEKIIEITNALDHGTYQHFIGVLGAKDPVTGQPLCKQHDEAKELAKSGAPPREVLCPRCPFRDGCPALKGLEGSRDAPLTFTVPQMLPQLLKMGDTGPVVFDDVEEFVESFKFKLGDLELVEQAADTGAFDADFLNAIVPFIRAVAGGQEPTAAEVLALGRQCAYPDGTFVQPLLSLDPDTLSLAEAGRLGRTGAIFRAVLNLYLNSDCYWGSVGKSIRGFPRALVDLFRGATPVIVISAYPDMPVLRKLVGQEQRLELVEIHVEDKGNVTQIVTPSFTASRKKLLRTGMDGPKIKSIVRHVLGQVPGQRVAVGTFKPIADEIRKGAAGGFADVIEEFAGTIDPWHYGKTTGLNSGKTCTVSFSLGDDRTTMDEALELASGFLGMADEEAQKYYNYRTSCRLAQFHGRLRHVRRDEPLEMRHVGSILPANFGRDTVIEERRGRKSSVGYDGMPSGEQVKAARLAEGLSQEALARKLKVSLGTVKNWESEKHPIPADIWRSWQGISIHGQGPSFGAAKPVGDTSKGLAAPNNGEGPELEPIVNFQGAEGWFPSVDDDRALLALFGPGLLLPADPIEGEVWQKEPETEVAPARMLLDTLRDMGCTVTRRGDRFTVAPMEALDDDLRRAIREHRFEMLAVLETAGGGSDVPLAGSVRRGGEHGLKVVYRYSMQAV